MAKVIWSDRAAQELLDIVIYLRARDIDAARSIGVGLYELGQSLSDFPNRGRPASGGTRELVSVPPYILRYRVDDDRALILRIRHGRRKPLR